MRECNFGKKKKKKKKREKIIEKCKNKSKEVALKVCEAVWVGKKTEKKTIESKLWALRNNFRIRD